MSAEMEHTVASSATLEGTSLHTGEKVSLTLKPAPAGYGFKFRRIDLDDQPFIDADVAKVQTVERATTLAEGSVKVHTVEHILSALCGMGVDNAIIEMDANEPPIGDGSSQPYVELIKQAGKGQQLRLRAIVTRGSSDADIIKRASLLRNDSVHGAFKGTVIEDLPNKSLIINGQIVHMIDAANPEDIDYTIYGIQNALIIDNTGVFTNREALSRHLQAKGVGKVLLTAPGKEIPNVVYGINQDTLDVENENIFSAASCTTNAISPILKVINDHFGVVKGHIETVHAYTNDQNLLDNMHKKPRRGRAAAVNMVITSTGAGSAVTKVIPELKDKLTANAVRVPTPNGSLAILSLELEKTVDLEQVNAAIKDAALHGELVNQIYYSFDPELVSSDIIGNTCCSVFDSNASIVSVDGKNVVLYAWYDNEFGYTKQVIRMAKYITQVRRAIYY